MYAVGDGRGSRCHLHQRAHELPRVTPPLARPQPEAAAGVPLLRASGVSKTFRSSGTTVHALTDVDIEIRAGETLGLVGESGSGKTTLARVLLGIVEADAGAEVALNGDPLAGKTHDRSREQVKAVQIVFQNPDSALNRRHTVRRLVGRALSKLSGLERIRARTAAAGADPVGAPGRPQPRPASKPALRRAEAAGRDRASVRRLPTVGGVRRADLRAGRVGAGGSAEPAGRAAGKGTGCLPVHQPRPGRDPLPVGSHLRAVPRPRARAGLRRSGVRGAAPPLHRGAAVGGADGGRQHRERIKLDGEIPSPADPPSGACSTPAAHASWGGSARPRNRRWWRTSRVTPSAATSPSTSSAGCSSATGIGPLASTAGMPERPSA